jgi:hypothetical protein
MKEMRIEDLLLYDSNKGKYLEGKLLVDAITPILGTTTIIEDSNNHVIPVVFYDFLLGGLNGEDAVAITLAKIPKGSRIRIAEPFMKVFRDITIISDISESVVNEDIALTNVKTQGNIMVKKKVYNAAIDVYYRYYVEMQIWYQLFFQMNLKLLQVRTIGSAHLQMQLVSL